MTGRIWPAVLPAEGRLSFTLRKKSGSILSLTKEKKNENKNELKTRDYGFLVMVFKAFFNGVQDW